MNETLYMDLLVSIKHLMIIWLVAYERALV